MSYYIILCYIILYCIILYYSIVYYSILYYIISCIPKRMFFGSCHHGKGWLEELHSYLPNQLPSTWLSNISREKLRLDAANYFVPGEPCADGSTGDFLGGNFLPGHVFRTCA